MYSSEPQGARVFVSRRSPLEKNRRLSRWLPLDAAHGGERFTVYSFLSFRLGTKSIRRYPMRMSGVSDGECRVVGRLEVNLTGVNGSCRSFRIKSIIICACRCRWRRQIITDNEHCQPTVSLAAGGNLSTVISSHLRQNDRISSLYPTCQSAVRGQCLTRPYVNYSILMQ